VDHVVLFDFPREPSEYLRRVGRTGRAGREGKVTALVYGKQLDVAKSVVQASLNGQRIEPGVNMDQED
jgi:ATP-dependent RNA helicase DDX18/HAS1